MSHALREGRYSILKDNFAAGGMGVVSKVYDMESDTFMAVKRTSKDQEYIKNECLAWIRLESHPNIATFFYYINDSQGNPLLFYEFVEGDNLRKWCDKNYMRSQKSKEGNNKKFVIDLVSIAMQIASAMCHAHQKKIFHLDLKLENILIDETRGPFPRVAIIDFGVYVEDLNNKQKIRELTNSDYFLEFRKNGTGYKWPLNNEVLIEHLYECDIQSFVDIFNYIIANSGFSKREFIDIVLQQDKNFIKYNSVKAILNQESLGNDKRFCQIYNEFNLLYTRMNKGSFTIPHENMLNEEAALVNQAISLVYVDGSQSALEEARDKLEIAVSMKSPYSNHLYSRLNYRILKLLHYGGSSKNLFGCRKKDRTTNRSADRRTFLDSSDVVISSIYEAEICIGLGYITSAWACIDSAKNIENMNFHFLEGNRFLRSKYYDLLGLLYLFSQNYRKAKLYFNNAIKLIDNYWFYDMHLAISITKGNIMNEKNADIDYLLKRLTSYGNAELESIFQNCYNVKGVTLKMLQKYLRNLKLDAKYLASIKSPLLPQISYKFDMSMEYDPVS